jgi:putative Mg2+ transporter-C (MgtC) family protein
MISEFIVILRLVLAAILGGIIGYEREKIHRPAGFRTHMLVCIGATLITICSSYGFPGGDPSRLAAGIITGVGFLGAGTVIAARGHIIGLTTAASVWTVGGVGIAVGIGFYVAALVTSGLILIILELKKIEKRDSFHKIRAI